MGFMDWLNQNVGQPLSKGVGWLNQNIVKPVGGFAGKVADTVLGEETGNAVRGLTDAVGKGADVLQKGLSKGEWDIEAGRQAIQEGLGSARKIAGGVKNAFANPEETLSGAAGRIKSRLPKSVQQFADIAASNSTVKAGMDNLKRRAAGQMKNLSKRMRV